MLDTVVGYCGGSTADPTYERIGDHTEALRVTFDPAVVELRELLEIFWAEHQPMPLAFTGTQYRSALFVHDDSQRAAAAYVREQLVGSSPFAHPSELTAFEEAGEFYQAEEYHQRWLQKQRRGSLWS